MCSIARLLLLIVTRFSLPELCQHYASTRVECWRQFERRLRSYFTSTLASQIVQYIARKFASETNESECNSAQLTLATISKIAELASVDEWRPATLTASFSRAAGRDRRRVCTKLPRGFTPGEQRSPLDKRDAPRRNT